MVPRLFHKFVKFFKICLHSINYEMQTKAILYVKNVDQNNFVCKKCGPKPFSMFAPPPLLKSFRRPCITTHIEQLYLRALLLKQPCLCISVKLTYHLIICKTCCLKKGPMVADYGLKLAGDLPRNRHRTNLMLNVHLQQLDQLSGTLRQETFNPPHHWINLSLFSEDPCIRSILSILGMACQFLQRHKKMTS